MGYNFNANPAGFQNPAQFGQPNGDPNYNPTIPMPGQAVNSSGYYGNPNANQYAPSALQQAVTGDTGNGSGLNPQDAQLAGQVYGANASMANAQTGAGANIAGSYMDYLSRLYGANAGLQGILGGDMINAASANNIASTNAGANEYATDEQRQQAALNNQSQNMATASQNQLGLANTAANQYATGTGYDIAKMNAQQEQLKNDTARYGIGASIQNAGINAQAGEQEAATSAAASELPTLAKYNMSSQLINSPLVSSILGQGIGNSTGGGGGLLGSLGLGGSGSTSGASPFHVNSGFDSSAIQGAINAAQHPNLFQPQQAQYNQSQFAPPARTAVAPTIPTGLNPNNFTQPNMLAPPPGSGQMAGTGTSVNLNTMAGPMGMNFKPAVPMGGAPMPSSAVAMGGGMGAVPARPAPPSGSFPVQRPITGTPINYQRPPGNLPSSAGRQSIPGAMLS